MATRVQRAAVSYPGHYFKPEDLLHFVELRIFTQAWDKDLGLDDGWRHDRRDRRSAEGPV